MITSTFIARIYERASGKAVCRRHLYCIGTKIFIYRMFKGFIEFNPDKYFYERI